MSSDHRKQCILKAVRGLFSKKGLGVTSKELSSAAGVSEALIYKLFSSKEGLYKAILEKSCHAHESIGQDLVNRERSTEVLVCATYLLIHIKVCGMKQAETDICLSPEEIHGFILQSFQTDGEFARTLFAQGLGPWIQYYIECIESAQKSGDLTPTGIPLETLIWLAHHSAMGIKMTFYPKPHAFMAKVPKENELITHLLTFLLRGMGVHQEAIDRVNQSKYFKDFKNQLENHTKENEE